MVIAKITVQDTGGTPVEGAEVSLGTSTSTQFDQDGLHYTVGNSAATARTDQNGLAEILVPPSFDLLAGEYQAIHVSQGYSPYHRFIISGESSHLNFDDGEVFDVALPTRKINIVVQEADGDPIVGADVSIGTQSATQFDQDGLHFVVNDNGVSVRTGASGLADILVPPGFDPNGTNRVSLLNGLQVPFTLPIGPIVAERWAYIIFDMSTGSVVVDTESPVVTGTPDRQTNSNGWYDGPVTITWTSSDPAPSAGAPTTPPSTIISTEGVDQTVTSAQSCDPVGLCSTGSFTVDIDMTDPTVVLQGPENGATYLDGREPVAGCATTDSLSGVATNATASVSSNGNIRTARCGGAEDRAGNVAAPVAVTYSVVPAVYNVATNTRPFGLNASITATVGTNGVPVGDTLTISVATGPLTGAASCSDSKGNSYAVVVNRSTAQGRLFVCSGKITQALVVGDVVTATYPGFGGASLISVNGISALATTGVVDAATINAGNSANPTSGNVTTTQADALLFGVVVHNSTSTFVPGAGYTLVGQVIVSSGGGNQRTLSPEFKLVSTTGGYAATGTLSSSEQWRAAIVAFK